MISLLLPRFATAVGAEYLVQQEESSAKPQRDSVGATEGGGTGSGSHRRPYRTHVPHDRRFGWTVCAKIALRCYFPNASGLKDGAPVTLEGVTIGNVVGMHVVPDRNPNPVEVVMQVGERYRRDLHTDSNATITTAGVLGDSFVDIDSSHATGPIPQNNAELQASGVPTIQSVINTSQVSIQEVNRLIHKIEISPIL